MFSCKIIFPFKGINEKIEMGEEPFLLDDIKFESETKKNIKEIEKDIEIHQNKKELEALASHTKNLFSLKNSILSLKENTFCDDLSKIIYQYVL